MPATATRSRENTAETLDTPQNNGPSPSFHEVSIDSVKFVRAQVASAEQIEYLEQDEENFEWKEVAPMVGRFTNEVPDSERKRRRGLRKRHRTFVMSGVFWVGLLFGIELVGLVFIYSIDLTAVRAAATLDKSIQKTSLDIALAQNQLAASGSAGKLNGWAEQLGYHKAQLNDMDDVTSSAPAPIAAATPKDSAQ